ncbi:hypothetical protein AQ753_17440 [Burkholderia pseudomallei]|nr:hypothetical protein AQ753_17440 [Burkholderia pseudomallei]OMT15649.1 hypothetical protein AQ754_21925 [Burkholderia pseudomallei]OMT23503.1 hypothetical protein AQ755_14490 [Burkholderia pseudomallei]
MYSDFNDGPQRPQKQQEPAMKHIATVMFVLAIAAVIGSVVNRELHFVADQIHAALVVAPTR